VGYWLVKLKKRRFRSNQGVFCLVGRYYAGGGEKVGNFFGKNVYCGYRGILAEEPRNP
jgi:hypothetical protein